MTKDKIQMGRRKMLIGSLTSLTGLLAGCPGDFPSGRELEITRINSEQSDSGWTYNITVRRIDNTDRNGFQNVSVVGYSRDGTVLCRVNVGDMIGEEMSLQKDITLSCNQRPSVIVPQANSSSCEENTLVYVLIYDNDNESWDSQPLECGDKIPPE